MHNIFDHFSQNLYSLTLHNQIPKDIKFDAVITTVAHEQFKNLKNSDWLSLTNPSGVIFDLKGIVPREIKAIRI